jgi:hypothetical protein
LTFDNPVRVTPGSTYYLRLGSDDVKVVLWGKETEGTNDKRAYVDADRSGGGWRTDYLPNFEIVGAVLDGNAALLELDADTAGAQIIPALYGKKIASVGLDTCHARADIVSFVPRHVPDKHTRHVCDQIFLAAPAAAYRKRSV